jgi:multicomponent Na+:H+ antiporter subunit C
MLMDVILLTAGLFAVGIFLMLERDLIAVIFGVAIFSNAANLFVLLSSGDPEGLSTPIVGSGLKKMVDPLPQALVLTAIVIGSGILAYLIFMAYRLYADHGTSDLLRIYKETSIRKGRKQ